MSLSVLVCDSPVSVVAGGVRGGHVLSRYIGRYATFFRFVCELPLQRAVPGVCCAAARLAASF